MTKNVSFTEQSIEYCILQILHSQKVLRFSQIVGSHETFQ